MTSTITFAPSTDSPSTPRPQRSISWMLVVIALIIATPMWWSVESIWIRLHQSNPQSPWETEILLDAWRVNHHLPVYSFVSENEHCTHQYGALINYAVAGIFWLTGGFDVHASRWISTASGLVLVVVILWNFARGHGPLYVFIAATILAAAFYRARGYFSEGRPDVISILLSMIALWMFYLAFERRALWIIPGCGLMILGFFFKQTAVGIAIVPAVALLFLRPTGLVRKLFIACIPLAATAMTLVALKLLAPRVYFYMVQGAQLYALHWELLADDVVVVLTSNVLFVVTLIAWLLGIARSSVSSRAVVWLLAACLVQAILNGLAHIKEGGQTNGYLPVFLAMNTFAIGVLPGLIEKLAAALQSHWKRLATAALIGCVIFADTTSIAGHSHWALSDNLYGDSAYKRVIRRARKLHGKVICPDDPTVILQAKNILERNLTSELDALGRKSWPPYLRGELASADYVIRVDGAWTSQVRVPLLQKLGYVQVKDPVFNKTAYSLWQRKHKKKAPVTP